MVNTKRKFIKELLYAAEIADIRRLESLPSVKYEHSDKFKNTVSELLLKTEAEEKRTITIKKRKAILIAAIISLLALTITACSVITPVREFVIEVFEKYTLFTSNSEESELIEQKHDINYLPSGYEISESFEEDSVIVTIYQNKDYTIMFKQSVLSGITHIDSEGAPAKELNIDGKTIYLFTKWKNDRVIWTDGDYKFTISYPEELDFSEVEKMILGVVPTDQ